MYIHTRCIARVDGRRRSAIGPHLGPPPIVVRAGGPLGVSSPREPRAAFPTILAGYVCSCACACPASWMSCERIWTGGREKRRDLTWMRWDPPLGCGC